ncbi:MAG TPA: response regulator [Pyrinomonadaceae bacterium]|jgi:DNA-binding response OmpR family regulator
MTIPPPRIILYLEDNRMLSEIICDVLQFAGWYVKASPDSIYSLAMLECTKEHFDLLLFDHEIHGIKGLELVRRVRRMPHRKGISIILISLEDLAAEASEAGADAFLRKPYNLIELVDTIRRLFAAPAG